MPKLISPPGVPEIENAILKLHWESGINKARPFIQQLDTMKNGELPKFTNCDLIEMGTEVIYNEGAEKYYLRIFLTYNGQTRYEDLPYT